MFSLSNWTQSSDGGGGIDILLLFWVSLFFPYLNFTEIFDFVSWADLWLCISFVAEVHKVSRPENEQLRNDSKRQIGKLLYSESHILCCSIRRNIRCIITIKKWKPEVGDYKGVALGSFIGAKEHFFILIMVVVVQMYTCSKML